MLEFIIEKYLFLTILYRLYFVLINMYDNVFGIFFKSMKITRISFIWISLNEKERFKIFTAALNNPVACLTTCVQAK